MATKKYKTMFSLDEMKQLAKDCSVPALKRYLLKRITSIDYGMIQAEIEISDTPRTALGLNDESEEEISSITITKRNAEIQYKRYMSDEMSPEEEKEYERTQGVKI